MGGGWRLRLLENSQEVGGGVFPLAAYRSPFPATDDASEREMAEQAAYEDALAEASAWLASRGENGRDIPEGLPCTEGV